MSDLNQPAYYLRREQQERRLAAKANADAIRRIHEELAEQYAALAVSADAPPRPTLRVVTAR